MKAVRGWATGTTLPLGRWHCASIARHASRSAAIRVPPAAAGCGHLRMAVMIGIAVGASLAADLMWYSLGRWRGTGMLRMLARLAPNGGLLVRRARGLFLAHVRLVQFGARFLPELNAIASGLAGASNLSVTRFVCYGAASALVWAGAWMGLGYVLSHPVTETRCLPWHPADRAFPRDICALSPVSASPPPSAISRFPSGPFGAD
jgi:hypothetical protein